MIGPTRGLRTRVTGLFRKARFSQTIEKVLQIFCTFENGYSALCPANGVFWIQAEDFSCFRMSTL